MESRRTVLSVLGAAATGCLAGCGGDRPTATASDSERPVGAYASPSVTRTRGPDEVRLEATVTSFPTPDDDRPIWVLPAQHRSLLRTAADSRGFRSEVYDNYPAYDLRGVQESVADDASETLGSARIDGQSYAVCAEGGPASRRRFWYTRAKPNGTATPVTSLDPAARTLVNRVFDRSARGRARAIEQRYAEGVASSLSGDLIRRDQKSYRLHSEYVVTPDWPPDAVFLGYRLDPSDVTESRDLRLTLPVDDTTLFRLLTDGLFVSSSDDVYRLLADHDPVLLTLTAAWTVRFP